MKITVKRIASLALATVMAVGVISGCGSNKAPSTTPSPTSGGNETPKQVTLNVATWINNKDADGNYVDENVAKKFMEENPNIKVNWQLLTENNSVEYMEKIDLAIAGGEELDVISFSQLPDYADRVRRKMVVPLDDYLAKDGKKVTDLYYVDTTEAGKVYALPYEVKFAFVMFNKTMLDEAGLAVPSSNWTWDDFREYSKKLTKGEGADKRYGSYFWTVNSYRTYGVNNAFGLDPLLTVDGKSNLTDPNIKDWLQFYDDMEKVDKSLYPYADAKAGKIAYRDLFFQGKIAMLPIGTWMIQEVYSSIDKYPHDWVTAFAPVPQWQDNDKASAELTCNYASITVNSKNQDAAYKYLRFNSDEGTYIRATGNPAVNNFDVDRITKSMMGGKEELYHVESLKSTLADTVLKPKTNSFPYSKKVQDTAAASIEKYLVGGATLDEAIAEADAAIKEIIASSK